jgi:hypothetical protein
MKEAMIYGTAGLTAGVSVLRLTELVKPKTKICFWSYRRGGYQVLLFLAKLVISYITGKSLNEIT